MPFVFRFFGYYLLAAMLGLTLRGIESAPIPKVDFGYAFGFPHRVTAGLPDSSDKTLVDCAPGSVTLSWTYGNLTGFPVASFMTNRTQYRVAIQAEVDGKKIVQSN